MGSCRRPIPSGWRQSSARAERRSKVGTEQRETLTHGVDPALGPRARLLVGGTDLLEQRLGVVDPTAGHGAPRGDGAEGGEAGVVPIDEGEHRVAEVLHRESDWEECHCAVDGLQIPQREVNISGTYRDG